MQKNVKLELIKRIPLFEHCTKKELAAIAAVADELAVPAGRVLAAQGKPGREFVVIVDGAADVHRGGRRINRLGAGDFLGEIALVSGSERTATVTTTEPSRLLVVTDRAFKRAMRETPSIQGAILRALSQRLEADALQNIT